MWVAFALQKLLTFFQQTISAYSNINVNFNVSLTNDIVSFEQLGPEVPFKEKKNYPSIITKYSSLKGKYKGFNSTKYLWALQ